jgi:hypothetical protein
MPVIGRWADARSKPVQHFASGEDVKYVFKHMFSSVLSTLRSYVEAMGGKLRLVAEFPDRRLVIISGLNIPGMAEKPKQRGRRRAGEDAPGAEYRG